MSSKKVATSIIVSSIFIISLVGVAFYWLRKDASLKGEDLQITLALSIVISGFLAGFFKSLHLKKISFWESLLVTLLFAVLPLFRLPQLEAILAYGSSTAYLILLLLSADLILLLFLTLGGCVGYIYFSNFKKSSRLKFLKFNYESFLGRRFLMAKSSGHVISLITLISVFAVVVGASGMIVVMSVMNGFSADLRSKIIGTNAPLIVFKFGDSFLDYAEIQKKVLEVPEITGATPFALNEVMISSESNLTGSMIKGVDVKSLSQVSALPGYMIEGNIGALENSLENLENRKILKIKNRNKNKESKKLTPLEQALAMARASDESDEEDLDNNNNNLPGIILGQEMAVNLHVMLGDVVNVVSPVGEMGPSGPIPKAKAFRVAGLFFSGMYEYDAKFTYIALKEAQSFFSMGKSVTGLECKVGDNDIDNIKRVSLALNRKLGGYPYNIKDWIQMNQNIFSALRLEKIAMFIILTSAIFMASLLILVALIMVVLEKAKEIAILKSMGATDASIMKIFVTYGLTIGSAGAVLGVLIGVGLCKIIALFGIGLDPQVYYITNLPIKVENVEVLFVAIAVILISFLATIPPALYAAKLKPVDGLRLE